jgi:type I restriction enzyme S subunit
MESNWIDCELGDLVELKRGYDLPKSKREEGSVPIVSSSGVSGTHSEAKINAPGVVTGRYGTIGKVFYVEEDFWPLNTSLYVKDFKGNDPLFVYYLLQTISFSDYTDKGAVPGINRNHVHKAKVKAPSCKEVQRDIGEKLYQFEKRVALNLQSNQTLEQMAQALFKSWFVDFDPVIDNALAAGNDIPEALQQKAEQRKQAQQLPEFKPLADDIRTLFPSEFEQTDKPHIGIAGWIPNGWEVSSLEEHTDFQNGYAFKSKELTDSSENAIPILKMGHIQRGGGFNPNGTKSYLPKNLFIEKQVKCYAKKGDLLMAMTDMKSNMVILGCTALMPEDDKYLVNQRVGRIRKNKSTHLDYSYLYFYTNFETVVNELRSRANSGVQVNLTTASIKATGLLVPSKKAHEIFDLQVKALLEKYFANDRNSSELSRLRDILLPKLISGEM